MKLNRKGYMLVEIVIASVLAFGIAYYLLNLTYKFKNTGTDIQESYYYMKDKILITKNIMTDLERGYVKNDSPPVYNEDGFEITFKIYFGTTVENRKLKVYKNSEKQTVVEYGKVEENGDFSINDSSYYIKEISKSLIVGNPEVTVENNTFSMKIPLSSMYTDNIYDIMIFSSLYNGMFLSEVTPGSYVSYKGNNGCDAASGACNGKNANSKDGNNGYCGNSAGDSNYQFLSTGWRVAYIQENTAYLVSAGAPECLCTNSDGTFLSSGCNSSEATNGTPAHIKNLNEVALKYCNSTYAYNGVCDSTSAWNINSNDFQTITGSILSSSSCYNKSNSTCGLGKDLIDVGGFYWYSTPFSSGYPYSLGWAPDNQLVYVYETKSALGIRPIIRLNANIMVAGGTGSESDPYVINIAS